MLLFLSLAFSLLASAFSFEPSDSMPHALCPMPSVLCPMPYAPCSMLALEEYLYTRTQQIRAYLLNIAPALNELIRYIDIGSF